MTSPTIAPDGCRAVLAADGAPQPCPSTAQPGFPYCARHTGPLRPLEWDSVGHFFAEWELSVARALAKRTGRLESDDEHKPLEHDPDLVRALLPLALPLYRWYWRVEVHGIENLPTEGAALLAANHSGSIPIDGAMLKIAVLKEHGRNPWLLAGDIAFQIPGFRELIRLAGNARADRDETLQLLRQGELLGVFPEGYKGIGKGWRKRYQLQRFGRGGFVEVAMETGAPIVPVAIIGAEEAYPMIGNLGFLASRIGAPYVPVTPTFPLLGPLGMIPFPSKWMIVFGEPLTTIEHGPKASEDMQLVLEMSEEVRQRVQKLLHEWLPKRRRVFF